MRITFSTLAANFAALAAVASLGAVEATPASKYPPKTYVPKAVNATQGDVQGAAGWQPTPTVDGGRSNKCMTLSGDGAEVILDYGTSVAGEPFFVVQNKGKDNVKLRSIYSEGLTMVHKFEGDGPFPFANLHDSYRRHLYDVAPSAKKRVIYDGYLQGGQRWQRLVLEGEGAIDVCNVGFVGYVDVLPHDDKGDKLAGYFESNDEAFNALWTEGVRTAQLNCIPKGTVASMWHVENGYLRLRGQHAAPYLEGVMWDNYTVKFEASIANQQVGWVMLANSNGEGYQMRINETHFGLYYGTSTQNVTTLPSFYLDAKPIPEAVKPLVKTGKWFNVEAKILDHALTVKVNGKVAYTIDPMPSKPPSPIPSFGGGTIGFGGSGDDESLYRNLLVTDSRTGQQLYKTSMLTEQAKREFGVVVNPKSVILDGAKRDRLIWGGDIALAGRTISTTFKGYEYLKGSMEMVLSWQKENGAIASTVPASAAVGNSSFWNEGSGAYFYSFAYELYTIFTIHDAWKFGALDDAWVDQHWWQLEKQMERGRTFVGQEGLVNFNATVFLEGLDFDWYNGPRFGMSSKASMQLALCFKQMAEMATALGKPQLAMQYTAEAKQLNLNVNRMLYNATKGVYDISSELRNGFALDVNVWALLSGAAAEENRIQEVLDKTIAAVTTDHGLLAHSPDTGFRQNISPYVEGFLLFALFQEAAKNASLDIQPAFQQAIKTWQLMSDTSNANYTGTFWEVLYTDGQPGLDEYTSLAHAWSSAPASIQSVYVLGIQPVQAGFKTWQVAPNPLSLSTAKGKMPTPYGAIDAEWTRTENKWSLTVQAPSGTRGNLTLGIGAPLDRASTTVSLDGKKVDGTWSADRGAVSVPGKGGRKHTLQVTW